VRFQVLTAASVKMTVFWDVTPYSLEESDLRFRGVYFFHHQGIDNIPEDSHLRANNLLRFKQAFWSVVFHGLFYVISIFSYVHKIVPVTFLLSVRRVSYSSRLAGLPGILIENFLRFPQSFQANIGMIGLPVSHYRLLPISYPLTTHDYFPTSFDVV
jgi:hypothetical protein